ncbi:Biofilm associated protein A [Pantoea sp. B9002]|uniref:Ig-like domain-containing protein n=1 Tax=Pantoea sp. B9002 TaxID=2726979 RepID=UPI0015A118A6|nr:Ig-like domain-containing protein [Pantoea sp. B9002]NWA61707.1 Biofilm associated protein A [Pantoea sp. B9002]
MPTPLSSNPLSGSNATRVSTPNHATAGIPATISYAVDDVGSVQGKLASGASTDDFAPMIVGQAEPNSIVYLYAQNNHGGIGYKGSVIADANGDWSIQSRSMISGNGIYSFHATYVNSIDDYRPDFVLNMQALKDIQPVIDFARDDSGAMTGQVYHRGTTDDKTPVLEGRGAPGSMIEVEIKLSNGGWQSVGRVPVDEQGNWQLDAIELSNYGEWSFRARGVAGEQTSGWSESFQVIMIPAIPLVPTINFAGDDVGLVQDPIDHNGTTDDATPTLQGAGTPGQVIEIVFGLQGESLRSSGSVMVGEDGKWSFTSPQLHQTGVWEYQVRASNGEMKSSWSGKFLLNLVTEDAAGEEREVDAPGIIPATISYAVDDVGTVQGKLASGASTDDFSPMIVGKAEPNSIVYLYAQNNHGGIGYKGSVIADANGDWSIQSRSMISGNGIYSFHATYVNSVADYRPDFVLNMQALKDMQPVIDFARDDSGAMTGEVYHRGTTDDKTPVLEGRGAPGSMIEVEFKLSNGNWQSVGRVPVDEQGNWQLGSIELSNYGEWSFRARGVAGDQTSGWSESFEVIMIPAIPLVPTINFAGDDVGLVQDPIYHNGTTDDATPTLQGAGTPGQVIEIVFGLQGESLRSSGSAVVGEDGKWSFTSPELHQPGIWEYQARASNGEMKSDWSGKFQLNLAEDVQTDNVERDESSNLTLQHLLIDESEGFFVATEAQDLTPGGSGATLELEDILPAGTAISDWLQQTASVTTAGAHYQVYAHDSNELLKEEITSQSY